jgi:hypothetical protein
MERSVIPAYGLNAKTIVLLKRMKEAGERQVFILLNQDEKNITEDTLFVDIHHYFVKFKIIKMETKKNIVVEPFNEYFYVFCKDDITRERIKTYSGTKSLKFVGQELVCSVCNDDTNEEDQK